MISRCATNYLGVMSFLFLVVGICPLTKASDQPTHRMGAYMGGGISLPTSELGDKMGFHCQIRLAVPLGSQIEIDPGLEYHSLGDGSISLYLGSAGFKVFPIRRNRIINPFIQGDGGAAIGSGEGKPFFGAGFGFDVISKSTSVISLSIRYVKILGDNSDITIYPITLTLKGGS